MLAALFLTAAAPPVPAVYTLPGAAGNVVVLPGGGTVPAQQSGDKLLFVAPLAAGPLAVTPHTRNYVLAPPQFRLFDEPGQFVEYAFDKRPVARYVNAPHDPATADRHELTFKPFHHVFSPDGGTLLTNGPGLARDKALLYPHHRGLFYAFNKVSYADQTDVDVWHGTKGAFVADKGTLSREAGEVFARHRSALGWHGRDGREFATEERELTAYNAPGGTLLDFTSTLSTTLDRVKLDGDPQHAGFHFRAAMEVKDHGKADTYFLRPDGKGAVGETRNWEPKTGKGPVDLPWDAMSFVVGGKRYTVLRLDHPGNPKPARGSEREYGRFGDYFAAEVTPAKPLTVRYRVWVQAGEMTGEQCAAMSRAFVTPPQATAK